MTQVFTEEHHGMQLTTTRDQLATLAIFQLPEKPTLQERLDVAQAIGTFMGPSLPCDQFMDKEIPVIGVIAHPVTLTDMLTGETKECMRTIFLAPDGTIYSGTSDALYRFAEQNLLPVLTETGDWGPLVAGVRVLLARQRTRKGYGTYAPQVVGMIE